MERKKSRITFCEPEEQAYFDREFTYGAGISLPFKKLFGSTESLTIELNCTSLPRTNYYDPAIFGHIDPNYTVYGVRLRWE